MTTICTTPGNELSVTVENGGYRLRLHGQDAGFYYGLAYAVEEGRNLANLHNLNMKDWPPSEPELLVEWLACMVVALDGQLKAGA